MNLKLLVLVSTVVLNPSYAAVQISESGSGQVAIVPFYSVSDDLNTLISVSNNTNRPKVFRVSFRESKHSVLLLNKHIYLAAHDTWAAVMNQQRGLPQLASSDNSCNPFAATDGFPGIVLLSGAAIEQEEGTSIPAEELALRIQTGHIEVYDLGDFAGVNTFVDCDEIKSAWQEGGKWDVDPSDGVSQPSGGLSVSASLIQVNNGFAVNIPPTYFESFYTDDSNIHGEPTQTVPDLSSATQEAIFIHQGQPLLSQWDTGFEAVGALLNKSFVSNDYNVNSVIAGETEWVLNLPTKRYHHQPETSSVIEPFSDIYAPNGNEICAAGFDQFNQFFDGGQIVDRDGLRSGISLIGGPPIPLYPVLCEAVNVITFNNEADIYSGNFTSESMLTDSQVLGLFLQQRAGAQEGMAEIFFDRFNTTSSQIPAIQLSGLPVMGFAVQKYQNFNAQPGLLAAYATALKHRSHRQLEILSQ